MDTKTKVVSTSHGDIAVVESLGTGSPMLMIHGNSSCKEVFGNQLGGSLGQRYRLIALDLPGHGKSSDASDPTRSYSVPAYADMAVEVLDKLEISRAGVLGWSLGGHIGIEMISRFSGLTGLLVTGTSPISKDPGSIGQGYKPSPHMNLVRQGIFSEEEADAFAHNIHGTLASSHGFLTEAVKRADGRARRLMFEAFAGGKGDDQRRIVETAGVPLAVVLGGADPFVNHEYLATIRYANLWDGAIYTLPCIGHAPFWQAPEVFDRIFARFLMSVH